MARGLGPAGARQQCRGGWPEAAVRTGSKIKWLVVCAAILCAAPGLARPAWAQASAAATADTATIRPQIEDLLRRLTAAVGAADKEAYLACVSMSDPVFA